jgi:hypothetical protein
MRKHLLVIALILGSVSSPASFLVAPGWAQAPPPVPAEPDAERRTRYSGVTSAATFPVGFDIYGDGTDFTAWLEVWVNGTKQNGNWSLVPVAGSFTTLARPLLAANLNVVFTTAQSGTIDIVGARRPRRTSQLSENSGVTARDFNQVVTDLWMTQRERWDRTSRSILAPPGETLNPLVPAATRAGQYLCFDGTGQPATCAAVGGGAGVSLQAGTGINIAGSNPIIIGTNLQAGAGVRLTGTSPIVISASSQTIIPQNAGSTNGTTTGSISSGSTSLTLAAASDFATGQGIRIDHAGAPFSVNQPTSLTVSQVGTAGSTAYAYTIASISSGYGVGQSIANVATATGNATLSDAAYNHLSWSAPSGTAPRAYAVYGNKSGSLTLIGYTYTTSFDDVGIGSVTAPSWLPSTPPTSASLADALITSIVSGGGTTSLTLTSSAASTAASAPVVHDDTQALQIAVTTASGGEAYIPAGIYRVSSPITSSAGVKISGAGFSGDQAGGFPPNNHSVSSCNGLKGTVLCSDILFDVFDGVTNDSVNLSNFQITYPIRPLDNTQAVLIKSSTSAGPAGNSQSHIKDMMLTGHCIGISLTNAVDWMLTNNHILYGYCGGVNIDSPNFPSYDLSKIIGNQFWGFGLQSSVYNKYAYHIRLGAGGDLAIVGNKLNAGGPNTNGILLIGQTAVVQNIEPMVITGNSIEASANCITVVAAAATQSVTALVITGNQGWCGGKSVLFNANSASPTTKYIQGVTITGNAWLINGGSGLLNMSLDGVANAVVTGNAFLFGGAASGSNTAIALGTNTTNVNVQSNTYDPAYSSKVVNFGTGNTVGGGSM